MRITSRTVAIAIVVALGLAAVNAATAQKQDDAADASRLIEILGLRPGSVVADVGAGSGALMVPIARHVGPTGHVYATDINEERLAELRKAAADATLSNVTVLAGAADRTNLADGCCDAVFMRHVYHHFGNPPAINASLLRSLKPGGRLAVVDFPPQSGISAAPGKRNDGDSHGVMPATIVAELTAAGFRNVRETQWPSTGYVVVIAERQ